MRCAVQVSALAPNDALLAGESRDASAHAPDITGAEYWSGACVVATAWLVFVLYAAGRALG
jgi:hypothetical protein